MGVKKYKNSMKKNKVLDSNSSSNNKKFISTKIKPVKKIGDTDKVSIKSKSDNRKISYRFFGIENVQISLVDINSKWYILELNEDVLLEDRCILIERSLISYFGEKIEYFLPIYVETVNEDIVSFVFFEGYIFLKSSDTTDDIVHGYKSDCVRGPVINKREIQYIYGRKINAFKREMLKKIRHMTPVKGDTIIPKVGVFENIKGVVISVDRKKYIVRASFKVSSRVVEAPIHVINIREKTT